MLESNGYQVTWDVLQVADYGVPQNRRRFVLLAGKGFNIPLPTKTYSRTGAGDTLKWRTLRDAIGHVDVPPLTMKQAGENGGPVSCNWHVVRDMSLENQRRLRHAVPGKSWTKIPKRLRPDCHKDRKAGFSNVYGRMTWDQVPVTITGGCVTLSKGRFGHPSEERTISVREAALIQTFPEDYVFDTPYIDKACDIIGNALPCDFAEVLARQCYSSISDATSVL